MMSISGNARPKAVQPVSIVQLYLSRKNKIKKKIFYISGNKIFIENYSAGVNATLGRIAGCPIY